MARKTVKTIRLDPEDAQALKRAEADGISSSELVRRGLPGRRHRHGRRLE